MPIITDYELQNYIEKESEHKKLEEELNNSKDSFKSLLKQRNLLLLLAVVLFIGLIIFLLLKNLKPELFINQKSLESKGLLLVDKTEYDVLKEINNNAVLNKEIDTVNSEEEENSFEQQQSVNDQIIYAVQIGAFTNNDIGLYSDSFVQFREFEEGGFYKYSLGAFETLEEAQYFRKNVLNLGFHDAFVASYQNGQRLNIEGAY